MIRAGSKEYAEEDHHYGMTTMQNEHVDVSDAAMHFHFVGKSGKEHTTGSLDVNDYLRETTGENFTAESFQTWARTMLPSLALSGVRGVRLGDIGQTERSGGHLPQVLRPPRRAEHVSGRDHAARPGTTG